MGKKQDNGVLRATIGRNLKKLRKEAGLTQQQVAEATGLIQQSVDRFEHGLRMPDAYQLNQLAIVFKVNVDVLMR